jgi:TetR/AcrR family transcriptional repressor of nem operon
MPRTKTFDEQEALQKAMDTFWKKGYHATSMQDLVDAMGINRASLYDTFGGKKALFDQSFELYRATNTAGMKRFLESQESVKEGFRQLFAMAIEESQSDAGHKGCFVVNATTELLPGDEGLQGVLQANKAAFTEVFYQFLQHGVERGEIAEGKDLQAIANMIFTLYNGIKVVGKIPGQGADLEASVEVAMGVLS